MKHKPLKAPRSNLDIAAQLRWLAEHMKDIGVSMDYFGGFNTRMAEHGKELVGAGLLVEEWAKEIAK